MFCTKCGSKLDPNTGNCPNCNQQLNNVESSLPNNLEVGNLENNSCGVDNKKTVKKKAKWWIPVLLFLGFMVCLLIGIAFNIAASQMDSSNLARLENSNYEKKYQLLVGIGKLFASLGVISALLVIPSIIIVIILYNKSDDNTTIDTDTLVNTNLSLDDKLLNAYIGENNEKIINNKFNFSALFFNVLYLIYRKKYVIAGISLIVFNYCPNVISNICIWVYVILSGFLFNKYYVSSCRKNIETIKRTNPNATETELINLCSAKGGTSVVGFIIFMIIWSVIHTILNGLS